MPLLKISNHQIKSAVPTGDSNRLMLLVSQSFLVGSLILFADETVSMVEHFSLHSGLEFLASLLFVVGSLLFLTHDLQQR